VLVLAWWMKGFHNLPVLWCLLPGILLLCLLTWSLAVLAGIAHVYFQDTQHLCEGGVQIFLYITPILYPPEMLRKRGFGLLVDFNPFAAFLDLIRTPVLEGQIPSPQTFLVSCLTLVVVAGAAAFALSRCQRRLIFQL